MRKIFFAIIALAALVGCNTDMMEEVATTPQYLTTSLEVDLGCATRVFNDDLVWSWESNDEIAAFQFAGENHLNKLTLKDNGKFGIDEFKYSTNTEATFMFFYPYEAYDDATQSLKFVQTGKWTPTLSGTAFGTVIDEKIVFNNSGPIEMKYLSAAFEIRVWATGGAEHKNIVSAKLESKDEDGTFLNGFGTFAQVDNLDTDTVVFNILEGTYSDFQLTLTDAAGKSYTIDVPEKTFELGKRTILNVEWEPTISFELKSWWTNPNDALEGSTIYFTSLSCDVEPEVLLDGEVVTVTDGKITGVTSGEHTVTLRVAKKAGGYFEVSKDIVVTTIPTLSSCNIYSSYNSSDNSVNKDNSKDGRTLYYSVGTLSDSYIQNNTTSTVQLVYGSATKSVAFDVTASVGSLALGQYNSYVKCTLANGYVLQTATSAIHVTGIPYTLNPASNDSWNAWSEDGNVNWNTSSAVRLGKNQWGGEAYIQKSFYLPADTGVKVNSTGTVCGTGKLWKVENTVTISVSGSSVFSATANGNTTQNYTASNKTATMSSSNPTIKCNSSYNLEQACVHIKSLTVQYQ